MSLLWFMGNILTQKLGNKYTAYCIQNIVVFLWTTKFHKHRRDLTIIIMEEN